MDFSLPIMGRLSSIESKRRQKGGAGTMESGIRAW
jgi:hypothetical protein